MVVRPVAVDVGSGLGHPAPFFIVRMYSTNFVGRDSPQVESS